jgi:hypothetical protein
LPEANVGDLVKLFSVLDVSKEKMEKKTDG